LYRCFEARVNSRRITADELIIPPEFRGLCLAPGSGGQIGGVRLSLIQRDGGAHFGHCYQQMPLRVLRPFHFAHERADLLYLMNPTAGLLDGDAHLLDLSAGSGVCAVVTGQSATRIHPAVNRFATQQWRIRVEDGACLVVLPGPAIPFQRCRYYQHVEVELAGSAQFLWCDIWLPGRYARGKLSEHFQFERIVQHLEIRRERKFIFRDRFSWSGPWTCEQTGWHLGSHEAAGSLFLTGPPADLGPVRTAELERVVFALASGDTCVRACGTPLALVRDLVPLALTEAGRRSGRPGPGPWLLHSSSLGPNHWFTL
jgi:urease accessory protein